MKLLILSQSKRERLVYWCFAAWFVMGMTAMFLNAFSTANISFGELAAYMAAIGAFIIPYVFGETKRASTKGAEN